MSETYPPFPTQLMLHEFSDSEQEEALKYQHEDPGAASSAAASSAAASSAAAVPAPPAEETKDIYEDALDEFKGMGWAEYITKQYNYMMDRKAAGRMY